MITLVLAALCGSRVAISNPKVDFLPVKAVVRALVHEDPETGTENTRLISSKNLDMQYTHDIVSMQDKESLPLGAILTNAYSTACACEP